MRANQGYEPTMDRQRCHYCRGCGRKLPLGCRRQFHKECLQADKRGRISEQRQREQVKLRRLLARQCCPHCGARYEGQRSDGGGRSVV